jgi:hypothetical protein
MRNASAAMDMVVRTSLRWRGILRFYNANTGCLGTEVVAALVKTPRLITPFLAFLPAALIAGCSSRLLDNAPAWPPADYRKIINGSKEVIPDELTKGAQVSEPRKTVAPQLYDWVVCLKSDTKPTPSFFAVFFEGEKIQLVRRAVQIDQCEMADYSPLAPPVPPTAQKMQIKRKT